MKKVLSPDEVNELMKDWFVRDNQTFVRITDEQKLAWEPENSSAYSTFIYNSNYTLEQALSHAYKLARAMVATLIPGKFKIIIDYNGENNYTNGKLICLSTEVFDYDGFSVHEKIDVFLGLAIHEAAHIMFTDFTDYLKKLPYEEYEKEIIHSIANVLEDERIEMLVVGERQGTARFLEKTKYYYFDILEKEFENKLSKEQQQTEFNQFFRLLLAIIRYPKNISEDDIQKFSDEVLKLKEIVTPYPESTKEVYECSKKIYELIKNLLPKEYEEKQKSELLGAISNAVKTVHTKALSYNEIKVSVKIPKSEIDNIQGIVEKGHIEKVYFKTPKPEKDIYNKDLNEVRPYITAMRTALEYNAQEYSVVHLSQRNGKLDTNKLVSATMGVTTVYKNYGKIVSDKIAMCFLIDMSGSMSEEDSFISARKTAILMYEAIKDNKFIDLFIYGHTADNDYGDGTTELYIFAEPGKKISKYCLGSLQPFAFNRDGFAIKEAALRIRKYTNRPCLMFVLSDGFPNAKNYEGDAAVEDTRKKVIEVENMGFDVIQIAINSSLEPSTMFKNYVKLFDIKTLPKDLNTIIKRKILQKQKIRLT
jgi:hypothetical protein